MVAMELEIWNGDWGLPCVDISCLEVMAYCKFSGAPFKLVKTNNPWRTPEGHLPVLKHSKKYIGSTMPDIVKFLRKQNYSVDFFMTPVQEADITAYGKLLNEKLKPALEYIWWVDSKNYVELTRPWYAKALPFPLNYFIPGNLHRRSEANVEARFSLYDDITDSQIETALYTDAEQCLTLLSNRLGDSEFFFGKSPSSLDAAVFAYLAPLLKVPFPNPTLQNHLKASDNLVRFVNRILHRYFHSAIKDLGDTKPSESTTKNSHDNDFPHKRRNQILSGLVAVLAMVTYAVTSGLIQVEITEDDEPQLEQDSGPEFFDDK